LSYSNGELVTLVNPKRKGEKMRNRGFKGFWALATIIGWLAMPALASAKEVVQQWELVNPAGVIKVKPIEVAPRISSLDGKTIGLKWNMKPGGNIFLDRIADLLKEKFPTAKIIKFYEIEPTTVPQSANMDVADQKAKIIAKYKPDVVIGSQCD
jgi:hypothetical protein